MMASPPPVVRYLIACERVQSDPGNPKKLSAINLIGNISPASGAVYPVHLKELVVLCFLTEGRGTVRIRIEICHDQVSTIYRGSDQTIAFGPDVLSLTAMCFRIRDLIVPTTGMYDVKLFVDGVEIASQPMRAR
jgi:hypothetical protein